MHHPAREQLKWEVTPELYDRVRRLWIDHAKAEEARNLQGLIDTLSDDCVYELIPIQRRWEGHEGARTFYTEFLSAFPDVSFELENIVIGPQGVIEVATMTGTQVRAWSGLEPSGRPLNVKIVIHFPWDPSADRFSGERIYLPQRWTQREAAAG